MTREFDIKEKAFKEKKTFPALIDFLEAAMKEKRYEEIRKTVETWKGDRNADVNYFYGVACIHTEHIEDGVKALKSVIEVNPNHFKALNELEKQNALEGEEKKNLPEEEVKKNFEKLITSTSRTEETESYRKARIRTLCIFAGVFVVIAGVLWYFFFFEHPTDFSRSLAQPSRHFSSLSFPEFEQRLGHLKMLEREETGNNDIKKALFYLIAYAVLDFHLTHEEKIMEQLRFYYTITGKKDAEMEALMDLISGETNVLEKETAYLLDRSYPESSDKIKAFPIDIPELITRKNVRKSFYSALLLYRRKNFSQAGNLVKKIKNTFSSYELAEKLSVIIECAEKRKNGNHLSREKLDKFENRLKRWKTVSSERYLLGEAVIELGRVKDDKDMLENGFFISCPGRYFCKDIVFEFMNKGYISTAQRMAVYMSEEKKFSRKAEDLKLVIKTSYAAGDYSRCYFAYRELNRFFSDKINDELCKTGALCTEKSGYIEEALSIYENCNPAKSDLKMKAKILELRYTSTKDEEIKKELLSMADRYENNSDVLVSAFNALSLDPDMSVGEKTELLDRIYRRAESREEKLNLIEKYIEIGGVFQAIKKLKNDMDSDKKWALKLYEVYNRFLLFKKAEILKKRFDLNPGPLWNRVLEFKELSKEECDKKTEKMEELQAELNRCVLPLLYFQAQCYRWLGDQSRTFSLINSMLNCNRNYAPALVLAVELLFYQNRLESAEEEIYNVFEKESYIFPEKSMYHNFLVLLLAEIKIMTGEDNILAFLKKSMNKSFPLDEKEQDKLNDIYEKLRENRKEKIEKFIKNNFKLQ